MSPYIPNVTANWMGAACAGSGSSSVSAAAERQVDKLHRLNRFFMNILRTVRAVVAPPQAARPVTLRSAPGLGTKWAPVELNSPPASVRFQWRKRRRGPIHTHGAGAHEVKALATLATFPREDSS